MLPSFCPNCSKHWASLGLSGSACWLGWLLGVGAEVEAPSAQESEAQRFSGGARDVERALRHDVIKSQKKAAMCLPMLLSIPHRREEEPSSSLLLLAKVPRESFWLIPPSARSDSEKLALVGGLQLKPGDVPAEPFWVGACGGEEHWIGNCVMPCWLANVRVWPSSSRPRFSKYKNVPRPVYLHERAG